MNKNIVAITSISRELDRTHFINQYRQKVIQNLHFYSIFPCITQEIFSNHPNWPTFKLNFLEAVFQLFPLLDKRCFLFPFFLNSVLKNTRRKLAFYNFNRFESCFQRPPCTDGNCAEQESSATDNFAINMHGAVAIPVLPGEILQIAIQKLNGKQEEYI